MVHLQPPSPVYGLEVFSPRLLPQLAMGTEMPPEQLFACKYWGPPSIEKMASFSHLPTFLVDCNLYAQLVGCECLVVSEHSYAIVLV